MHSSQAVQVAMLALVQALRVALGQHACAPLVSLATGLGLDMPTHPPQRGSGQEICWGRWCQPSREGVMVGLCRPVLARTGRGVGSGQR
jgi:hypothetical protein